MAYYLADPETNMEKLQELLTTLHQYCFIHDEMADTVSYLLSRIYPDENMQVYLRDGDGEEEDEIGDYSAPAIEIFCLVTDKEQFVQDYRNAIGALVWPNSFDIDYDELAEKIIIMRDSEMYQSHIMNR